jgi:hypothetical protein
MTQPLTPCIEVGTYVEVIGLDFNGRVINIRLDSSGYPVLTIELDNASDTPSGLYIARMFELRVL